MRILIPIRLDSEANKRGHWAGGAGRASAQRQAVTAAAIDAGHLVHVVPVVAKKAGAPVKYCPRFARQPHLPLVVTITRIAPRQLDDDNLARSAKAVRDQVAELLGIDDRDPRCTWRYEQASGAAREYGCCITIEART